MLLKNINFPMIIFEILQDYPKVRPAIFEF